MERKTSEWCGGWRDKKGNNALFPRAARRLLSPSVVSLLVLPISYLRQGTDKERQLSPQSCVRMQKRERWVRKGLGHIRGGEGDRVYVNAQAASPRQPPFTDNKKTQHLLPPSQRTIEQDPRREAPGSQGQVDESLVPAASYAALRVGGSLRVLHCPAGVEGLCGMGKRRGQ